MDGRVNAPIARMEVPVRGMDCAECTRHVQHAIAALPGVQSVEVLLTAEKAIVALDPRQVNLAQIRQAVSAAGYSVPEDAPAAESERLQETQMYGRQALIILGVVFAFVLFVVIGGELLGLFEALNAWMPWWLGWALTLALGYPVFLKVGRAALRRQVLAHTLMSVGALAALLAQEWVTALVVTAFMRVGDFIEHFTAERSRTAVRDLYALAPQMARVERNGIEVEAPVGQVQVGEIVVVRPGEVIPVDGEVVSGHARVNQATITGEALAVEAGPGRGVYAATLAEGGGLRVRATQVGVDTTFGRVIRLVEEAEANRAPVQRVADQFAAYYLPVVLAIAGLTYLVSRDPLRTVAVLVVACSCSFALATPIAVMASIGAAARRGLMIKGGKYLEALSRADVLLIDKTGTLTLGKPEITDTGYWMADVGFSVEPAGRVGNAPALNGPVEILRLAASAERYSEHPLAEAVRARAQREGLELAEPHDFQAAAGLGVQAQVDGRRVAVGSRRMLLEAGEGGEQDGLRVQQALRAADELEAQGRTVLFVRIDGELAGVLAALDCLRPEVPEAIAELRRLGISHVELLTGDNERSAAALAGQIGAPYQANLLPEDKIARVKAFQADGRRVVMIGDGVNDAPALAQADVGIAMGAAGSDVAIEAAHVALMLDDWRLAPDLFRIARRTMRVVKGNIAFTTVFNLVGLSLAAFGVLPPVLAAAAQSLPDLIILGNSSRLIRQK
jgi:Cd2+/Zn2+-exporting ATPase/Cu+-exporting ATPase